MNNDIDRLLSQKQPTSKVPPGLHESIMKSVRACSQRESSGSTKGTPAQWIARALSAFVQKPAYGLSLVLIVSACTVLTVKQLQNPTAKPLVAAAPVPPLDPALTARLQDTWNFLDQVGTNAPALISRPITQQLDQLSSQFHRTTELLLASIPRPPENEN